MTFDYRRMAGVAFGLCGISIWFYEGGSHSMELAAVQYMSLLEHRIGYNTFIHTRILNEFC